jgi:hypothetical protein
LLGEAATGGSAYAAAAARHDYCLSVKFAHGFLRQGSQGWYAYTMHLSPHMRKCIYIYYFATDVYASFNSLESLWISLAIQPP